VQGKKAFIAGRNTAALLLNKITELKDVEVGTMLVEELKLKRSTLTPKGPIYEDVWVKRLGEEG